MDDAGVFVDVVCYTEKADEAMMTLAQKYDGQYYYDSDQSFSNSLNEAFLKVRRHVMIEIFIIIT